MKGIIVGALGTVLIGIAAGASLIHSGRIDVAADTPHHPLTENLLEWARERSIERRAIDIAVPNDLSDPARIRRGAGNYDAMCVICHLAPGVADTEIRKGLYPLPPNLSLTSADSPDARRFWIIKHGIKASGMPAWQQGGMEDAAIWDLTALLKALPGMTPEQYRHQVATSDGHKHHGALPDAGTQQKDRDAPRKATAKTHPHNHANHQH